LDFKQENLKCAVEKSIESPNEGKKSNLGKENGKISPFKNNKRKRRNKK